MNKKLTEHIAHHVLANLGVLSSNFIDHNLVSSIIDPLFLLPEKISLENEKGNIVRNNIYGCQTVVADSKDIKILLADCTEDKIIPEYGLLVQLKDAPMFGVYYMNTEQSEESLDSEVLIAVSPDKKNWMLCNTYLQATFLAGMEQIRDVGFTWNRCSNYKEHHQQLLSFIKFHHKFYGESLNEG